MSVDSVASAVSVGLTALLVTVKLRCFAMVELQDASFSYGKEWDIHFGSEYAPNSRTAEELRKPRAA